MRKEKLSSLQYSLKLQLVSMWNTIARIPLDACKDPLKSTRETLAKIATTQT